MPDVDYCVRLCEDALIENLELNSKKIFELYDLNKVSLFRNKDIKFVENTLRNSKRVIETKIIDVFYDGKKNFDIKLEKSSNDNKKGADLFHILPNNKIVDIEVKFGQETDKNIGMAQFSKIFSTNIFADNLDVNQRKVWLQDFLITNNQLDQFEKLNIILNDSINHFNIHINEKNYLLTKEEQRYMEDLLFNNSGSISHDENYFIKFIIKGDTMRDVDNLPTNKGSWLIDEIRKIDSQNKRVNLFVKNHDTKIMIKFVLNWKNNYKYNGQSFPAKLGFGSPNWNVWINVEITLFD